MLFGEKQGVDQTAIRDGGMSSVSHAAILTRILDLSSKLIAIPSVTGQERPVMEFIERELTERGWNVERWPTSDPNRWNVFASVPGGTPRIVFSTHLDVVPAVDPQQFEPKLTETHLVGRGACDTKGIVGTMVEACQALRSAGASEMGLLFVVDEEKVSIGAKAAAPMLKSRGIEYIINGEPSDCRLVVYQKGVFSGVCRFEGQAYHSGYPENGIDANRALVKFCNAIDAMDLGSDPIRGKATVNFGLLKGGSAGNVVAATSEIEFWIRTVGPSAEMKAKIDEAIAVAGNAVPNIKADLEVKSCTDPFELVSLPGFETGIFSAGTDAPHLSKHGVPCLMYGPGSIHDAHTKDEKLAFSEIVKAYEDYQRLYQMLISL